MYLLRTDACGIWLKLHFLYLWQFLIHAPFLRKYVDLLVFKFLKGKHVTFGDICTSLWYRWRNALLWRAFFTTAIVAVALRALIDICKSGKCGLFGQGGLIMYDVTADKITYHLVDLPPVIVLGIIGGILGSLHNFLLEKVLRVYNRINEWVPVSISFLSFLSCSFQ